MDVGYVNKTWVRWIDDRPVDDLVVADVMETDPFIRQTLIADLELHRQLQSLSRTARTNDSFVEQTLAAFDLLQIQNGPEQTSKAPDTIPPVVDLPRSNRQGKFLAGKAGSRQMATASVTPAVLSNGKLMVGVGATMFAAVLISAFAIGMVVSRSNNSSLPAQASIEVEIAEESDKEEPIWLANNANQSEANPEADEAPTPQPDPPRELRGREQVLEQFPNAVVKAPEKSLEFGDEFRPEPRESVTVSPIKPASFATIAEKEECKWRFPIPDDNRIASQILDLESGKAEVQFDNGALLTISGKARLEIVDDKKIGLVSGDYHFDNSDSKELRWDIEAPNAKFRVMDRSVFDYQLATNGDTRFELEKGTVDVRPWVDINPFYSAKLMPRVMNVFEMEGQQPSIARFSHKTKDRNYLAFVNINGRVTRSSRRDYIENKFSASKNDIQPDSNNPFDSIQDMIDQIEKSGQLPPNQAEELLNRLRDQMENGSGQRFGDQMRDRNQNQRRDNWP